MAEVRVTVRVKPGASRARVGGRYGEDALVVSVNAPPVDGAANEAVARVVAGALGLRPRQVSVLSGHTARTKVLALTIEDGTEAAVRERITDLMGA